MQATVDVISVLHAVLQKAQMQHLSLSSCDICAILAPSCTDVPIVLFGVCGSSANRGYAGTIYNCNLSMLQDLGLQRTVAKGVLKKLHMHAITSLHNIIKERRYVENNSRYALQAIMCTPLALVSPCCCSHANKLPH